MKIAFLSSLNPYNVNNWSGTLYYIFHSLRKNHDVEWVGEEIIGEFVSDIVLQNKYDILIARDCSFIACLKVSIPIVYIGDTTFDLIKDSWNITNRDFIQFADEIERKAILNTDCVIYSSEWAKESAIKHYKADPSKIKVIEFGANLSKIPGTEDTLNLDIGVCDLLFIGKEWERKGGDKVCGIYNSLKSRGFKCTLTIIGSTPSFIDISDLDLRIIPFIDKSIEKDAILLDSIMRKTHFFILPTLFDCYGIVFCEASAYGIPSIASDVGGVSQVIKNGKNGFLLPPEDQAEDYADLIESIFINKSFYKKLRKTSRNEFDERLNWDVWSSKTNKVLEEVLAEFKDEKIREQENEFFIPTYIINLKERTDRRLHAENQFRNKPEFEIIFVEAVEHPTDAIGLWQSIVKIITMAIAREDDIIIICQDDHTFTDNYDKNLLFHHIIKAEQCFYWMGWYMDNQFIVVYQPLFQHILDYQFKETDIPDLVLSAITSNIYS